MLQLKSFYYIRHGETDWNLENRCMGQNDIPLNLDGIKQAEKSKVLLLDAKIETICYSPLLRTKQTAEIINQDFGCPLVSIENLKECNLGILEGQIKQNVDFIRWVNGMTPTGAETYLSFIKRTLVAINEALTYPNPLDHMLSMD